MTVPAQIWAHQIPAIEYLDNNPASMLDAAMGTGKSYIQIQNIRHTASHPGAKTLVLCPAAVRAVWRREFWKHARDEFDVLVLDGNQKSSKKAEMVAEMFKLQQSHRRPLIVVLNYDSFWRTDLLKVLSSVMWDKIVCDESQRIMTAGAKCSKETWKLGRRSGTRSALTGTPMPNNPGNIFAQYRFLNECIFGRYWTQFKDQFAVMNRYIPQKVDKWVNLDELHRKFHSIRFYIPQSVLTLPERQDIAIEVPMSSKGRKAYDQMKKESIAVIRKEMEDGSMDSSTAVAINGAVQYLRLLQLAQGYVNDEDGEAVQTDTEKRKVLMDLLQDAGEPVCVYGWFKHDLAVVAQCCELLCLRYGEISGDRKDLTPHATMPDDLDVMGVQCKSGSSGIDLTRARLGIILNSGMLSPGDYDQMLARQHRPGQTRNVVYYHLLTEKTIEIGIVDERGKKRDLIDSLKIELQDDVPF